jgi:hypothetical protein
MTGPSDRIWAPRVTAPGPRRLSGGAEHTRGAQLG